MEFGKFEGAIVPANQNRAVTVSVTKTRFAEGDVYHVLVKFVEGSTPSYHIEGRYSREDHALAAFHAVREKLLVSR